MTTSDAVGQAVTSSSSAAMSSCSSSSLTPMALSGKVSRVSCRSLLGVLSALVAVVAACPAPSVDGSAAGGGEGDGDGDGPSPSLRINEVMAKNTSTLAADDGAFADWVELFNGADAAVRLQGFTLADASGVAAPFPDGALVPAHGFLVVFADDTTPGTAAAPHMPFKVGAAGDLLALQYDGADVDRVVVPALGADDSAGLLPDGQGSLQLLGRASPGRANALGGEAEGEGDAPACTSTSSSAIVVNEVVVDDVEGLVDETGAPAPWIELFNTSDVDASLAGLRLADNGAGIGRFALPAVTVAAHGFVVFFADLHPERGAQHLGFRLTPTDTVVALFDDCGTRVQRLPIASTEPGTATALVPDGARDAAPTTTTSPSPGATNGAP